MISHLNINIKGPENHLIDDDGWELVEKPSGPSGEEKNLHISSMRFLFSGRKFISKQDIIKSNLISALTGDTDAIMEMVDYYHNKKQYGIAMIFSCFAAAFSPFESDYEKYKTYINDLQPYSWFTETKQKQKLIALKLFLGMCLRPEQSRYNLRSLKKQYSTISDPIVLIMLALEEAVIAFNTPSILFSNKQFLLKAKDILDESVKLMMRCELKMSDAQIKCVNSAKRQMVGQLVPVKNSPVTNIEEADRMSSAPQRDISMLTIYG
jgi:hypothetical protein